MKWNSFVVRFSDGKPLMYGRSTHLMSEGLNILGEHGWEMVGIKIEEQIDRLHDTGVRPLPFHVIFKRPKLEPEDK